jgi:hypothetical protein
VISRILLPAAVVLAIFVYMRGGDSRAATATITQSCAGAPEAVRAAFDWPVPAITPQESWLDLGLAPGFPPGSFQGHGPIMPPQTSYSIDGLPRRVKFYYRVNAHGADGWHVAASGAFTTDCAQPSRPRATPAVDVISAGP